MNKKCQVFTPPDYVEELLNKAEYKEHLLGKKVLENSCGDGNILVAIVRRYISDCQLRGYSRTLIKNGLFRDIVGYEIDETQYKKCIDNLNLVLDEYDIPRIEWKIYNEDFLAAINKMQYDYIIGNPPYITYSEIDCKDQEILRNTFNSCKKGKFDYCYAFIEKSISLLKKSGKMAYLIPSSVFKTVFGKDIRTEILPHVVSIKEYTQRRVFDAVLVKSAIIVLEGDTASTVFEYCDESCSTLRSIDKNSLGDKWIFSEAMCGTKRFGDFFKVSHAVATLLNDAFVLNSYEINDDGNYICDDCVIEAGVVRDTATPKSLMLNVKEKIIFPYSYTDDHKLIRYCEDDFKKLYPGAYKYLLKFKANLTKRNSDKNAKWFEYGRSQALKNLDCNKYLISTVISTDVQIYALSEECIPYAGMYIVPKTSEMTLSEGKRILLSKEFKEYVTKIGIHINGNSLRITSKDIENYMFER